jgi:membrane associated rhomboid family serine protease
MSQESALDISIADELTESPKGNSYITYAIMTVNVFLFIAMVTVGLQWFPGRSFDVLRLGASAPAITFGGQWWRIITSMFVHPSLLHLVVNMTTLFFIGSSLEPMLGKLRFTFAYAATGIAAALVSALWYIDQDMIYTGSSGAIAGLTGVFFVLGLTKIVPGNLKYLLIAILIFAGFNIFFAVKTDSGIDNAALLGGFVCGIIIGVIYYISLRRPSFIKTLSIVSVMTIGLVCGIVTIINGKKTDAMGIDYKAERFYNKEERKRREDEEKFQRLLTHFGLLHELAMEAMVQSDSTSNEKYLGDLNKVALNDWVECVNLMDEASSFLLTQEMAAVRIKLHEYANHRIQETLLLIKSVKEDTQKYNHSIDSIQQIILRMPIEIPRDGPPPPLSYPDEYYSEPEEEGPPRQRLDL